MSDQTQAVISSIDSLIAEHDRWENDPTAPNVPTQAMDNAVSRCIQTAGQGDVPGEIRHLTAQLLEFCELWLDYRNGEWNSDGTPLQKVWTAFRELRRARDGATKQDLRRVESVTQLRGQHVSDLLIAKAYGVRDETTNQWQGPFFENGQVQHDRIEQQFQFEAGKGERVIPADWVHPINNQIARDTSDKLGRKLEMINARTDGQVSIPDKGSPEELAKGGAFPHQVKKAFNLSDSEVRDLYDRLGLNHNMTPDLGDKPPEPSPSASDDYHTPDIGHDEIDEDTLTQLVLETHAKDETLGPADIARQLEEVTDEKVSWQRVNAILARSKKQGAAV